MLRKRVFVTFLGTLKMFLMERTEIWDIVLLALKLSHSGSCSICLESHPSSIDYEAEGLLYAPNCKEGTRLKLDKAAETKAIVWTYSVTWVVSAMNTMTFTLIA